MRIALAQINPTVGDLDGNVNLIVSLARRAASQKAQLVVFPELSITGYPPRDLVEKSSFLNRSEEALERLAKETAGLEITIVAGYVGRSDQQIGKRALNSAAVIEGGKILFRQHKTLLPTYDVFDEARYFYPAEKVEVCTLRGIRVALTICEDGWNDRNYWQQRLYQRDPVEELFSAGAEALICINASPYHMGKRDTRRRVYGSVARRYAKPVVYVNQVGGNDQLVFDGSSFALNGDGEVIAQASSFAEDLVMVELKLGQPVTSQAIAGEDHGDYAEENEAAYQALVLGTHDYITKCGFKKVLIGLSGGIDSSLVAAIAVEAVGKENVMGIGMPGPFSSEHSVTDARQMAECLGIGFEVVSIKAAYERMIAELAPVFESQAPGIPPGVTEENIQARLRGMTLMALSNKTGAIVLTTGNKSELSVGYCTLYGDMVGGLAVISDVPKTMVYTLSHVANQRLGDAIPENVFTKPPSAELRPDQKDSDSLPEYELLDKILEAYVEQYRSPSYIAQNLNVPLDLVRDIVNKVDKNEYKRQQAAPGLKVTTKAFGIGRRFPIAQRYSE